MGAARRLARRGRGPGCRGIPHPRRDDRASRRAISSSCTPSARSTAPPRASSRSCTGRSCGADEITDARRVENVAWFDAATLPRLAFDHNEIVDYALWRLRNKVGYSRIAHGLLADEFTLAELREVYESILGRRLDPANFRRQVENSGTLIPTERFRTGSHRPARLYRYNQDVELADRGPLDARD